MLTAGKNVAASPFPKKITLTTPDGWFGNIGGPYAVFLTQLSPTAEIDFDIFDDGLRGPVQHRSGADGPAPQGRRSTISWPP